MQIVLLVRAVHTARGVAQSVGWLPALELVEEVEAAERLHGRGERGWAGCHHCVCSNAALSLRTFQRLSCEHDVSRSRYTSNSLWFCLASRDCGAWYQSRLHGLYACAVRSGMRTAVLEVASVVLEVQRTPILVVQALDIGRADGGERGSLPAPDRRESRVTIWRLHPCPLRLQTGCISELLQDAIAHSLLNDEAQACSIHYPEGRC